MLLPGFLCLAACAATVAAVAIPRSGQHQQPRNAPKFASLVVFGDSFSDNGNEYRLSNQSWPEDPAYYQGRFSNGLEWNEIVAQNLSIPLHNYAFAGATSSNALIQGYSGKKSTLPVPSLDEQVDRYLANVPADGPLDGSLFVLLGGANDILFNFNITAVQPAGVLSGLVTKLRNKGAQNFLLINYPDLGTLPYDSYIPLFTQQQLTNFSHDLGHELASLQTSLHNSGRSPTSPTMSAPVSAFYLDLLPVFQTFSYSENGWKTEGFDQFGFYGSCLTGAYVEVPQRTLCPDPDKRVFWDEYHPTAHSHRIIAREVLAAIDSTS